LKSFLNESEHYVIAAEQLTGLTKEDLKIDSNEEFLIEIKRRGYDFQQILAEGKIIEEEWKEVLAFEAAQIKRAQAVLDVFTSSPQHTEDTDLLLQRIDEHDTELNRLIQKNLDSDSLYFFVEMVVKAKLSVAAIQRAHLRHAEHRAFKADVFAWCDDNMSSFPSMDAAAEAIAKKLVPASFRTVRTWIGEWKKLRSASKP
jgi:hypothetical protein